MGVEPPFLYDAVSYREFDPRAASRKSYQSSAPPRPKQEGPLVSFNAHPDSYLILPYGNTSATPMNPSVKTWVKWMRIALLATRILELIAACGLLVMMILVNKVEDVSGWIMRIVPGVVILHTTYAVYHLIRKASGRTAASQSFYMISASLVDLSVLPFYAYSALVAHTRSSAWGTILSSQDLVPRFTNIVFLTAISGGGLHIFSIAISSYLAVAFRKITQLPPDMNPLEDNLTSRHKRSKSSISTMTTDTSTKRLSTALEAKRSSGAPYEDLARPPTIPFFHTRTQSTTSFSTYKSTEAPGSNNGQENDFDFRSNLPSNGRYQPVPNSNSPRSSMIDQKRASRSPPKRGSYQGVPLSERHPTQSLQGPIQATSPTKDWYASDSLTKTRSRPRTPGNNTSPSPKKAYTPLHQRQDSDTDLSTLTSHPNPLSSNPSTPTPPRHGHRYNLSRDSPLSEIHNTNSDNNHSSRRISGDITNLNLTSELLSSHQNLQASTQSPSRTPVHPYRQPPTRSPTRSRYTDIVHDSGNDDVSAVSVSAYSDDDSVLTSALAPAPLRSSVSKSSISASSIGKAVSSEPLARHNPTNTARDLREPVIGSPIVSQYITNINANTNTSPSRSPAPFSPDRKSRYGDASDTSELNMKSKYYGKLKPGPPPIMVGGTSGERQVSGNDFAYAKGSNGRKGREVSGKVVEEGRGARFRKVSGM